MSGADLRDPFFEGHVEPRWQKRQRRRRRRGRARARANLYTVRWIDESICVCFYPAPEQGAQVRQIARGSQESVGEKNTSKSSHLANIWCCFGAGKWGGYFKRSAEHVERAQVRQIASKTVIRICQTSASATNSKQYAHQNLYNERKCDK